MLVTKALNVPPSGLAPTGAALTLWVWPRSRSKKLMTPLSVRFDATTAVSSLTAPSKSTTRTPGLWKSTLALSTQTSSFSVICTVSVVVWPLTVVKLKVKSLAELLDISPVLALVYVASCCRYCASWVCTDGSSHCALVNINWSVSTPEPPV